MHYTVIDVREPEEFATGHVDGAINVPPRTLLSGDNQLTSVPKDANLIVYCRTGSRSQVAIHMLKDMGYTNLVNGINKHHVEANYGL